MLTVPTTSSGRNRAARLVLASVTDDELALRTVIAELDEQGAPCGLILALTRLGALLISHLPPTYIDAIRESITAEQLAASYLDQAQGPAA